MKPVAVLLLSACADGPQFASSPSAQPLPYGWTCRTADTWCGLQGEFQAEIRFYDGSDLCTLTWDTTGEPREPICDGCLWSFEVHSALTGGETSYCWAMDNSPRYDFARTADGNVLYFRTASSSRAYNVELDGDQLTYWLQYDEVYVGAKGRSWDVSILAEGWATLF